MCVCVWGGGCVGDFGVWCVGAVVDGWVGGVAGWMSRCVGLC